MKDVEIIKARNVLSSRARTNLAKRLRVAAYCRVSTDSEDQLNSYKSQVQHYTDLIKSKSEWDLAGIYADEAITGTQVTKREDFQRLINDCMNGDVDMIITKSISRFARNTLDTLKYVRMLKEKGIAVFFEEENINTLTMDGELLLVILSSVAQQEVENISANVKKGLKMKMQRGELVGFQGCLGYDYHPEDKSISINEEEAEIVRYIFRRYIEGAGGSVIAQELENLGYKTKRGSTRWAETTVIGIIKNEKYKGDILMGKTFTLDPISKRRLDNFGEEDQFYMKKRIAEFRRTLEENEVLDTFDRYVFESIVEKVIVGGYDEDGNKDPAMLTFIYKTGFKNSLDGTNFKPPRKNSKAAKQNAGLCSHTTDEAKSMCSYHSDDTCRGRLPAHQRVNCSADRSGKLLRRDE